MRENETMTVCGNDTGKKTALSRRPFPGPLLSSRSVGNASFLAKPPLLRCKPGISARTESRNPLNLIALFMLLLFAVSGCSEESRARYALKKIVHKEIDQFNKYHQREVKPKTYETVGGFYRIYHQRVDPVVNMRRTNSVDTPYVATIRFTEDIYLTRKRSTREETQRDIHFILSNSSKRELVYAYVGGSWKRKEVY